MKQSTIKHSYLDLFKPHYLALTLAIIMAVSLVAIDVLIVETILPNVFKEIGGFSLYAWAIGAYGLGNFMSIPTYSVSVSKIGGKKAFTIALLIFILGAVVGGCAPSMFWVVLGRTLQGLGAGGFFAIPFRLIGIYYPSALQPRAIALTSGVWGAAAVAGPMLGAKILDLAGWRWVFWFNIPVGTLILVLAWIALRQEKKPEEPNLKLNFSSPLLLGAATVFLMKGLTQSWPINFILILGAIFLFFIFKAREKRHSSPMIPNTAWKPRIILGTAFFGITLTTAAFGGASTYLPLVLQNVWDKTALGAGVILTIGSLSWSLTALVTPRFSQHPRNLISLGTLMILAGIAFIGTNLFLTGSATFIYLGWFLSGMGMGFAIPTYNTLALDISDQYPTGTTTGTVLLGMTWGFGIGPFSAGMAGRFGFGPYYVSNQSQGETWTIPNQHLIEGTLYSLIFAAALSLLALLISTRLPKLRLR